jgi:hypothetical protein
VASTHVERQREAVRSSRTHDDTIRTPPTPHALQQLQSQVGNAGLVELLSQAQPKLVVGHANDPTEVEADTVARDVVASLGVQRTSQHQCASDCSHSSGGDGALNRSAIGLAGGDLDTSAEQRVKTSMGGGAPLPGAMQRQMEGAFGADFGGVRVHADETSAELARSMSARAFTLGGHIFLGAGQRTDNHELMAHELTHTIQQGASTPLAPGD